jgi:hypothetical protein
MRDLYAAEGIDNFHQIRLKHLIVEHIQMVGDQIV